MMKSLKSESEIPIYVFVYKSYKLKYEYIACGGYSEVELDVMCAVYAAQICLQMSRNDCVVPIQSHK